MRCASTRTQARPRNWAQSRCPRTRSESPSQPLGPESRNTPRPHESVSIRHTFLKFLFHCFAVCQLVPMSSSFHCLLLYTLHQSQENPCRPVTRRVIMKRDGRDTPKKTSESNSKCFICSSIPTSKKQGLCIWKNFHRFSRSHLIFGRI